MAARGKENALSSDPVLDGYLLERLGGYLKVGVRVAGAQFRGRVDLLAHARLITKGAVYCDIEGPVASAAQKKKGWAYIRKLARAKDAAILISVFPGFMAPNDEESISRKPSAHSQGQEVAMVSVATKTWQLTRIMEITRDRQGTVTGLRKSGHDLMQHHGELCGLLPRRRVSQL